MNNDTYELDAKLQRYVKAMAINRMPFGREWDSSAKKLQDELKQRGIKLPQKLYWEYKMPDNVSQQDFMDEIIMEYFCNYFFKTYGYAGKILKNKYLKMSDKVKIFKYVWNNRKKYKNILQNYENEIRKLNPELANVKVDDSRSLVYGAMFGFAPAEIAYFSDGKNRNFAKERETLDLFKNRFGISVSYVLAPETAQKIIDALNEKLRYNPEKER